MRKFYILSFFFFLVFFSTGLNAQNRVPAFAMNERLGMGVNMGNAFEAPSETEWGNPWKPEYFRIMADLGFTHVRLPVRWEPAARSSATPPYTITPVFMERIQAVVDSALKHKLHIIINMHHHEALFADPAGQKERFLSQWNQIATHFQEYSDSLLFEVLNEPHGNITPALWNEYFADALDVIRQTNPTRVVLLGVAEFGGLGGIVHLDLPEDEYIILSPHYYNPFNFTHQGAEWVDGSNPWLGTVWSDTEADRETVETEFSYAKQFSESNHIPIHVGEFGAYSKADIDSRERWTTFLARWFEEQGFSCAYWEFSAGFGVYNPVTKQFVEPLVDALFTNPMPEPVPISAIPLYTSNFSSGNDGWSLGTSNGGSGSMLVSGGKLNVTITSGGTQGWHVQLVKGNIALVKDKMYRISFKASATAGRGVTFYAGKASDPWNAYSGTSGVTVGTEESRYAFSFTMTNPSDPAARLVFDLGNNTEDVVITEVKVEELSFVVTSAEDEVAQTRVTYFPNPATTYLTIESPEPFHRAQLFNLSGQLLSTHELASGSSTLYLGNHPKGLLLLRLSGNRREEWMKVIKE